MKKSKKDKIKISGTSFAITIVFIFSTIFFVLTAIYFSPDILKPVTHNTHNFTSAGRIQNYVVKAPVIMRIPKVTDGASKRLSSGYARGDMTESQFFTDDFIVGHSDSAVEDGSVDINVVKNSYDSYVYTIADKSGHAKWLIVVANGENGASNFVCFKEGEE